MIDEDFDRNISQLQLRSSMLKRLNNDQQFLIVYFVVAFNERQILAIEDNRM
jgi:hypothetical protein